MPNVICRRLKFKSRTIYLPVIVCLVCLCVCLTFTVSQRHSLALNVGISENMKRAETSENVPSLEFYHRNSIEEFELTLSVDLATMSTCAIVKPTMNDILYRNTHGQIQSENDGQSEVVVFSASYDDRPIVGYLPWIRILGVRRILKDIEPEPLYCYVWYFNESAPFVARAGITVTGGEGFYNRNGYHYGQHLFSCQLERNHPRPEFVSLSNKSCRKLTTSLPVNNYFRTSRWRDEFVTCGEPVFGNYPPELLVEWIEVHSLLGVTHSYIYNGSLSTKMNADVFDYYEKRGRLTLIQMPPPAVDDFSERGTRLGSPVALKDCMLRNMHTSRFIIPIDFDEIIVPRLHANYSTMIEHIDRTLNLKESHHTYAFRMAYFFQYFPHDVTQLRSLKTLRIRHRTPAGEFLFGSKSFVDPRRCLSVFNHYCWVRFPSSTDKVAIDVDPMFGLTHHYRRVCPFKSNVCRKYDEEKLADDMMLKFAEELKRRVLVVLEKLQIIHQQ